MVNVFLTNLTETMADSLRSVLTVPKHRIESKPLDAPIDEFLDADVVFAGADDQLYMSLLRNIRLARPRMPFIVVTSTPNTSAWLAALDAGATDYCSAPFRLHEIKWLIESALLRPAESQCESSTCEGLPGIKPGADPHVSSGQFSTAQK